MTRQREAFAQLVARGEAPTDAVRQVYPDIPDASSYGRKLMENAVVSDRVEILETQFILISRLNRDSLTAEAMETATEARFEKKYSATASLLRLAGDLQGLTQSNPVAEATSAFLSFLATGEKPQQPAIGAENESIEE